MISKAPGVEDIFPDRVGKWNLIINTARDIFRLYNFREIVLPVMEFTEVFARGLGDETDIVSKEMFTFEDRGGRSLTLRPEGTASLVRAYVENGEYNRLSSCRFFYCGPMFRAERPQKGRLRQFNQFGAELLGPDSPYSDFEIISMINDICLRLGIDGYRILLNSIGCAECRPGYVKELKNYFASNINALCAACARRLDTNPLRILDCKEEKCSSLKDGAPLITSFICPDCGAHHSELKKYLASSGILFEDAPMLVRGLDYYTKTTFEFVTDRLGGQNAFAAGGRYNGLVEKFGGKPTPAVGFAAGIERIFLISGDVQGITPLDVFVIYSGTGVFEKAAAAVKLIRDAGFSAEMDAFGGGFKSQFKKADRENARFAVIIGEDELINNAASVKNLSTGKQESIQFSGLTAYLKNHTDI